MTLNAKVKDLGVELCHYNIKFKFIEGIKNTLADTLPRLAGLNLMQPNPPVIEGHEYKYNIFEPLPEINVSSSKSTPVPSITLTSTGTNNQNEDVEMHFSLSLEKLINMQNNDNLCKAIMK